jgi:hypothetical protein
MSGSERRIPERRVPAGAPWAPAPYELADAGALQALMAGAAEPHQQQRALRYIVEVLAGAYEPSYRPSGSHDTAFAEGRRYVGLQIVKLAKLNLAALRK